MWSIICRLHASSLSIIIRKHNSSWLECPECGLRKRLVQCLRYLKSNFCGRNWGNTYIPDKPEDTDYSNTCAITEEQSWQKAQDLLTTTWKPLQSEKWLNKSYQISRKHSWGSSGCSAVMLLYPLNLLHRQSELQSESQSQSCKRPNVISIHELHSCLISPFLVAYLQTHRWPRVLGLSGGGASWSFVEPHVLTAEPPRLGDLPP